MPCYAQDLRVTMAGLGRAFQPALDMYALQYRPTGDKCLGGTVCDIAMSSNVFLCT